MNIDLIPDLYKFPKIFDSYKNKKLVVFLGAGVPALWGCMRWKEMATSLIESCHKCGAIDYWSKSNLFNKYLNSPRKLLTIAKHILGERYLAELQETLTFVEDRKNEFPDVFKNLFALDTIFLTTNIDQYFDGLFNSDCIHDSPDNFYVSNLKTKNLFHLHGVLGKPNTLVMTIDEYIERYQKESFKNFLESVFFDENYCFLFIGYGVDELEIIDYIILKYSEGKYTLKKFINKFYILLPFFQKEESLLKYEQVYFDKIKMAIIPYAIDTIGFDQLYFVVEKWKDVLTEQNKGDSFYKYNKLMDNYL